ncbi:MAG: DMT family transporter [Acidimicrobiales bacterium]
MSVLGLGDVASAHVVAGLAPVVVLSLASATSYGLAAVLQHRAAIQEPRRLSMQAGLLGKLVRRPWWLLGNMLDGVGYLFQFLALRRGSLALVEPFLVLSLIVALVATSRLERKPVSRRGLASAVVIMAGLVLFLVVARPGEGHPRAPAAAWAGMSAGVTLACIAVVLGARRAPPRRAAVLLAAGSGAAFGYVAAVTERAGHLLDHGVGHLLATWVPYALVVGAGVALLLTQSAFHAGALHLSLPTLTVAQPIVGIAIGLWVFGEHIATHGLAPLFEVVGLAVVVAGVYALTSASPIGFGPGEG